VLSVVATLSILLSILLYIAISVVDARRLKTTAAFFHDAGKPWQAIVSLTAFNVTLGTGVTYVLAQAQTTGLLLYLTPLGVLIGYIAIAEYYRVVAYRAQASQPNVFYLLGSANRGGSLTVFARVFGLFMAATYVLVLAFELRTGTKVILDSLLGSPTNTAFIGFALIVFGTVAAYTAIGGLKAAVDTDVWQIGFIILFLVCLFLLLWDDHGLMAGRSWVRAMDLSASRVSAEPLLAVTSALLALVMAVTTQFYSIINVHMGSTFEPQRQASIFRWVGVWSALIYAIVASAALVVGSPASLGEHVYDFLRIDDPGPMDYMMVIGLFAGMLAVLLSTLDNMTISISKIVYENLLGRNSLLEREHAQPHFTMLRVVHFSVAVVVVMLMSWFIIHFENEFSLLLTILFAATVMSPIACTAVLLHARGNPSILDGKWIGWAVLAVTIGAWICYLCLTIANRRQESVTLHLMAFSVACLIAAFDFFRNYTRSSQS